MDFTRKPRVLRPWSTSKGWNGRGGMDHGNANIIATCVVLRGIHSRWVKNDSTETWAPRPHQAESSACGIELVMCADRIGWRDVWDHHHRGPWRATESLIIVIIFYFLFICSCLSSYGTPDSTTLCGESIILWIFQCAVFLRMFPFPPSQGRHRGDCDQDCPKMTRRLRIF